jgi:hypothetical protein
MLADHRRPAEQVGFCLVHLAKHRITLAFS